MNFANTPSFANQGLQPGGRLFLCVLTSLALLIGDSQYSLMEKARDAISVVLYPLQRAANVPLNLTMQVGDFFTAQAALKRENDALRERDLIQSSHLMRMSSLEKELQQLRRLNALAAQPSHAGVVAEVLYTGRDPFSYRLIIDKGSSSGIASGQAVIDENGLIGQVTRVQPLSAEVTQVQHLGTSQLVTAQFEGMSVKARVAPEVKIATGAQWLRLAKPETIYFSNDERIGR